MRCLVTVLLALHSGLTLSAHASEQKAATRNAPAYDGAIQEDVAAEWQSEFDRLEDALKNRRAWFKKVASQTYRPDALILDADRDPLDVILRRTTSLLTHLKTLPGVADLSLSEKRLTQLAATATATNLSAVAKREQLFMEASALQRQIAFSNPLLRFTKILFIKNYLAADHCCDQYFGWKAKSGGGLFVLENPFGAIPTVRNLLDSAVVANGRLKGQKLNTGSFRAAEVSFDARTALFAYTQCGATNQTWCPERSYHIFKVNSDGSDLSQLTDGPCDDFDPCFLPNGRIAFISERRGGFGRCHGRPVPTYTLHSMNVDGSDIVPLSYHETNEWQPSVTHDGRIVYTRWDYVDRGDCIAHHPWICYPDGRDPRALHGNYPVARSARPDMEMDIRAIPGSNRFVATAAPHHGQAYGSLIMFDPEIPDDGAMAPVKRLTPDCGFPETEAGSPWSYGSPWPLSETFYLCVYAPPASLAPAKKKAKSVAATYGIYLVDAFGNKFLLYRDQQIGCLNPIPLQTRPCPPIIPNATAVGKELGSKHETVPAEGTIACLNVYDSTKPWPADTKIKALRVVQLFPKATPEIDVPKIGVGRESLARAVLGEVPVEEDGSVYFTAPAGKVLYFQVLDQNGCAVQSMQSDTYLHPGERLTCVGCHEATHQAGSAVKQQPLALQRAPSKLKPAPDGANPICYPRLVQPVLDRYCVACHQKEPKAPALSGEVPVATRRENGWSRSYMYLAQSKTDRDDVPAKGFVFACSGKPPSRQPAVTTPGEFGARASKLYRLLARGHYGVKLPTEDMQRLILWLDCNSVFYGAYRDMDKQAKGELIRPTLE